MSEAVEVALDLRALDGPRRGLAQVHEIVDGLSRALEGRPLGVDRRLVFEATGVGRVALDILGVPSPGAAFRREAPLIVRGVADHSVRAVHCAVCATTGAKRLASLLCACPRCSTPTDEGRVPKAEAEWLCDEHALLLDGSLSAFAPEHVPLCPETKEPSSFVCRGPTCPGEGRAWGPKRAARHPENPERLLCRRCYAELFPPCLHGDCNNVGTLRCEHWAHELGRFCGKTLCSEHGRRWQVFGPHRMGLERCPEHGRIRELGDAELVTQLALGTAGRAIARRSRRGRRRFDEYYDLPSLASVRHILIKTRGVKPELSSLLALFGALDWTAQRGREPYATASHLLERRAGGWRNEVSRDGEKRVEGEALFEKLRQLVLDSGDVRAARALEFSHYSRFRPRAAKPGAEEDRVLFVRLDKPLRGRFIGPGGTNIRRLATQLGVTDIRIHDALKAK